MSVTSIKANPQVTDIDIDNSALGVAAIREGLARLAAVRRQ
jgi:hypothetical protein